MTIYINEQEKKLRERAMLDAMEDDEVEYYGSDHGERAKGKGESLEDALDRVVAETEVTHTTYYYITMHVCLYCII
jgi:hypothetical protein